MLCKCQNAYFILTWDRIYQIFDGKFLYFKLKLKYKLRGIQVPSSLLMGKVLAMGRKKDKKRRQPNPQQSFCTSVDVDAKLQQTISIYQTGQLQQAEQICQQILKDFPRHANALHLLGVIAYKVE